jgi:hypothetical protein
MPFVDQLAASMAARAGVAHNASTCDGRKTMGSRRVIGSAWQLVAASLLAFISIPLVAAQVTIPGTSVSMEVPAGFSISKSFSGLENPSDGSTVMVVEMPVDSYAKLSALFSDLAAARREFSRQNVSVERTQTVVVGGKSVPMIVGTQPGPAGNIGKYAAVLQGDTTVLITFNVFDARNLTPGGVEKTLSSVSLLPPLTLQQKVDQLPFSFTAVAPFRVYYVMLGVSVGLTAFEGGTDPTGSKPLVLISRATGALPANLTPTAMAEQLIHKVLGFEKAKVTVTKPTVFAGGDGIYMEASIDARKVVQYLAVRGGNELVHLVAYGAKAELDSAMTAVTAIVESVAIRK